MRRLLHDLGFSSYAAYLAAPHWQQLRRRFYASARVELMRKHFGRPVCQFCLRGDRQLELHHRTYARIGRERMADLVLLCGDCHEKCHQTARRGRTSIGTATEYIGAGFLRARMDGLRGA